MALLLFLVSFAPHDPAKLGLDDWREREAWSSKMDNVLSALLLPATHTDPEIAHRIAAIKTRNLRWLNPVYVEGVVFRDDVPRWVGVYVVTGRSLILRDHDTFAAIHAQPRLQEAIKAVWPMRDGENDAFLRGSILPGEYEAYLAWIDYHQHRAPMPATKE